MAKKNTSSNSWLWIVVVILIAVGAWALLSNTDSADAPTKVESVDEEGSMGFETPNDSSSTFVFMDSSAWDRYDSFRESVAELNGGDSPVSIVQDPTDQNILYVSTVSNQEFDPNNEDLARLPIAHQVNIYRYENDSYNWERIYKQRIELGDISGINENALPRLTAVGIDDGKLILSADAYLGTDACFDRFAPSDDEKNLIAFKSLDLEDPYAGLSDYELPAELIEAAGARVEECISKIDPMYR